MSKSNQHEYAKRVEMARLLIVMGETPENICRNMSAGLNVTERQARRYITEAKAEIQREIEPAKPYLLAEHVSIRRNLRKRAIDAGDFRAALEAAKDEARLFDLYPATKSELTGKGGGAIETRDVSLTDEERASRVAAILDRARTRRDRPTDDADSDDAG